MYVKQGYGAKRITLYDIRAELSKRYKDLRTAYHRPTVEECFNLLTKETPETFYIGMSVSLSSPCPPIDSIITLMTVWRITGKIIGTTIMVITCARE